MRPYKIVKVFDHEVKICVDDEGDEAYGHYLVEKKIVLFSKLNNTAEDWRDTYIHEIVEAINDICGLELKHSKIQTLSAALAQALGEDLRLRLNDLRPPQTDPPSQPE